MLPALPRIDVPRARARNLHDIGRIHAPVQRVVRLCSVHGALQEGGDRREAPKCSRGLTPTSSQSVQLGQPHSRFLLVAIGPVPALLPGVRADRLLVFGRRVNLHVLDTLSGGSLRGESFSKRTKQNLLHRRIRPQSNHSQSHPRVMAQKAASSDGDPS
jgi:hypothetical protein